MEQLFITEFDTTELPGEYHFSHNFAVRLHDDLLWLIKDKSVQKKLEVNVKFDDENFPDDSEDIFDWLEKNGKQDIIDEIYSKHLTSALLSDLCNFTFQALDSAKKFKLTVAMSLVRKPFLENLLILEQLLVNEKDFLQRFEKHPENFDPGKIKDEEKKHLIKASLKKTKSLFISEDIVFDLRFDKTNSQSFYAISNLATHLVTTRHSEFKTDSANMNFIFSTFDEIDSQLHHFYYFVPYILYYTVEVVDTYLYKKKIISIHTYNRRKFYRMIGQILHFDQFNEKSLKGNSHSNKISRKIKIKCESCSKTNQIYKSDLFSLIQNNHILCKHCLVDLYFENKSMKEVIKTFAGY